MTSSTGLPIKPATDEHTKCLHHNAKIMIFFYFDIYKEYPEFRRRLKSNFFSENFEIM